MLTSTCQPSKDQRQRQSVKSKPITCQRNKLLPNFYTLLLEPSQLITESVSAKDPYSCNMYDLLTCICSKDYAMPEY